MIAECNSYWQNISCTGRIWFILAEHDLYWQNLTSIGRIALLPAEYDFHWQNMIYTGLLSLLLAEYMHPIKNVLPFCSVLLIQYTLCWVRRLPAAPREYGWEYQLPVCCTSLTPKVPLAVGGSSLLHLPTRVNIPNDIWISSTVFVVLTVVISRHTHTHTHRPRYIMWYNLHFRFV